MGTVIFVLIVLAIFTEKVTAEDAFYWGFMFFLVYLALAFLGALTEESERRGG